MNGFIFSLLRNMADYNDLESLVNRLRTAAGYQLHSTTGWRSGSIRLANRMIKKTQISSTTTTPYA